ncbi:MAG: PLP-dependent transferase [Phycisphaerales bacterium]|nr:PLP-dependent transferase [Phycisphaerales bacterium]
MKLATQAVHVGQHPDPSTGATIPPVYFTSTYTQEAPGKHKGYDYSRSINPTRENLEACIAALESGAAGASFASGLAASNGVIASLCRPGDSLVAFGDMYGGTYRLLERCFVPWGLKTRYTENSAPSAIADLVDATTRIVWIETPTNPMLRLIDIAGVAQELKKRGSKALLVVDNTFATPALQRPIELGADIVVHSTTKYLGGHSDVIGGAVVTRDAATMEPIRFYQNAAGGVSGPLDCYLTQRGIKTLPVRLKAHCENAMRVAAWAMEQSKFERVIYPGLKDHADHELAMRQMAGFGGIVSCVVKGGLDGASRFMSSTKLFACAESLGGVESLVNHPAIMTHASIPREIREARGVVDGLVRLSVGIEDADDLIADLEQALKAV